MISRVVRTKAVMIAAPAVVRHKTAANRENVRGYSKEKEAVSVSPTTFSGVSDPRMRTRRTPLKLRAAKKHSHESVVLNRSRTADCALLGTSIHSRTFAIPRNRTTRVVTRSLLSSNVSLQGNNAVA